VLICNMQIALYRLKDQCATQQRPNVRFQKDIPDSGKRSAASG